MTFALLQHAAHGVESLVVNTAISDTPMLHGFCLTLVTLKVSEVIVFGANVISIPLLPLSGSGCSIAMEEPSLNWIVPPVIWSVVGVYSVKLALRDFGRLAYMEAWMLSNSGRMFVRGGSHPIG
jgi:hypothetical protein